MRIVFASPATPDVADLDVVATGGEIYAGLKAQCDVAAAGCELD